MYAGAWTPNQQNLVLFVLVNSINVEVAGLGNTFTLEISKAGAAFQGSAGTKAEISDGWYSYLTTAGEADTPGPIALRVFGVGTVQQNLEYVVLDRATAAIEFTYTITNTATLLPIEGVEVEFTTDAARINTVWRGTTDAFGVARDLAGNLPRLDAGVYFAWRKKAGFSFSDPDVETVS
jgi:hypothetical protein